jgi:hypothetical protein
MGANRNWTFGGPALFAVLLTGAGCSDGGGNGNGGAPPPNTMTINADLAAAQIIGGSPATGTATAAFTLNIDDDTLSGTVTLTGLTATSVTINTGFAGEEGPVIVTLTQDNATTWSVPDNTGLTAADQDALASGAIHVLVNTAAQPDGAVRGQLIIGDIQLVFVVLTDAQEVPLLTSSATAVAAVTLDPASGDIVVHVHTAGLDDAAAAHVHTALAGVNGGVLIGLNKDPNDVKHWSSDGAVLDAAGLEAFGAAELYINVHTPDHQGGEVRGQIVPPDMAVLFVTLSGAEEVPAVVTNARAIAAITYDPSFATGGIAVHVNTSGLDDAAMAHVHQAPEGANGPVLFGLTQDPNDVKHWQSDGAVLNAAGVQAFNAGDLYVNVHTPDFEDGEVRGQIIPSDEPPNTGSFKVASITPAAGADLTDLPDEVVVTFNRAVMASTVAAASVELTASGGDGSFSDGNEMGITPTAVSATGSTATIDLSGVTVADDTYRIRLSGTGTEAITDVNGNVLDGNSDDAAGGDFVSMFSVETSSTVTFEFIQNNVFTPSCALSGCHAGASPQQGMNLSAGQAYAAIVSVPSTEVSSLLRVKPGEPDESYLVHKIEGSATVGGRMPLGGAPLPNNLIQAVRDWISQGAHNADDPIPPPPPGY